MLIICWTLKMKWICVYEWNNHEKCETWDTKIVTETLFRFWNSLIIAVSDTDTAARVSMGIRNWMHWLSNCSSWLVCGVNCHDEIYALDSFNTKVTRRITIPEPESRAWWPLTRPRLNWDARKCQTLCQCDLRGVWPGPPSHWSRTAQSGFWLITGLRGLIVSPKVQIDSDQKPGGQNARSP